MASRTNFLPRLIVLALVGAVPVVTACGGKTVSLGTTDDKLTTLQPTDIPTTVAGACPTGYAHPNICCEAAANEDPTCGAWLNDPFRACESGWSTYPNALSCCQLSNSKNCIDTPEDAGVPTPPPPPYGCGFTCPPGWYPDNGPIPVTAGGSMQSAPYVSCCQTLADGTSECYSGGGYAEPVSTCTVGYPGSGYADDGGVAYPVYPADALTGPIADSGVYDGGAFDGGAFDDGGEYDGGIGYADASFPPYDAGEPIGECDAGSPYSGYDGGVASLCEPCPAGWSPDPTDPVLCCQVAASGVHECFSQATGSAGGGYGGNDGGISEGPDGGVTVIAPPPEPIDAGMSSSAPFCTSSGDTCSCQNDANNHAYVLDCSVDSSGKTTCFCEQDGNVGKQLSPTTALCNDTSALGSTFSASSGCGFPSP